ncbi:MAG: CarD family transcriptional regulator [Anaerolineae bacterium]
MSIFGILDIFDQLPAFQQLVEQLNQPEPLPPLLLPKSARAAILSRLYLTQQVPVVLLTGRVDSVSAWQQALEMWLPEEYEALRFPEPTPLPYDRGPWSQRSRLGRVEVLTRLLAGQHPQFPELDRPPLIVSSARAFLQKTLPQRRFVAGTRALRVGQILDLEKTLANWVDIGYEEASVVEAAGQFSRRGGIVDIFPVNAPYPVRIELFGDEIDTLRYFDPATQRSIEWNGRTAPERVLVSPTREALPGVARAYAQSLADEERPGESSLPSWRDDIDDLAAGRAFPTLEFYLPLLYPRPASLLDYLPENALVVVDDWLALETAVTELHDHANQIHEEQPSLPPNYPSPLFDWPDLSAELNWWQPLILGESSDPQQQPFLNGGLMESFEAGPRYGGQVRPLMTQLKSAQREGDRVVIVSQQATRLAELWREESKGAGAQGRRSDSVFTPAPQRPHTPGQMLTQLPPDGSLTFIQGSLAEGFSLILRDENEILLDLLSDAEIFGWNRPAPRRWRKPAPIAPEARYADITAGDIVVHLEYGIGQFKGLVTRSIGGAEREYLLVEYANNDVVYVPVHQADRMSKWIGSSDQPPPLNRLNEKSWGAAKAKAQQAADELAGELLELYAARETVPGHAFAPDGEWQAELEASFPYRETEDQLRVIAEVKADMERPQPMDRLVCGDVGYGKTEVALRAAFKAVLDGWMASR